jgi:hypothetical protein
MPGHQPGINLARRRPHKAVSTATAGPACGCQARQTTVTTCVTAKTINAAPRAPSIHHSLPGPARPQQNQKRPRYRSRYMNLAATVAGRLAGGHDLAPGRAAGVPLTPPL